MFCICFCALELIFQQSVNFYCYKNCESREKMFELIKMYVYVKIENTKHFLFNDVFISRYVKILIIFLYIMLVNVSTLS